MTVVLVLSKVRLGTFLKPKCERVVDRHRDQGFFGHRPSNVSFIFVFEEVGFTLTTVRNTEEENERGRYLGNVRE